MAQPVKYKLSNFEFKKMIEKNFSNKIEETGYFPVSLVLIKETKNNEGKVTRATLISIAHEKSSDAKQKVAYIEGEDADAVNKLIEELEKK